MRKLKKGMPVGGKDVYGRKLPFLFLQERSQEGF